MCDHQAMIEYRVLSEVDELARVGELETIIWGHPPELAAPYVIMRITARYGGVALGAFDREEMIGISWAFPVRRPEGLVLWSHLTGVLPQYRGRGIGFSLKQQQRTWALANGYDAMHWSFDPFQPGNANFNLRRLGVVVRELHRNLYGEVHDKFNPGVPTDRFEAAGRLNDERVRSLAAGHPPAPVQDADAAPFALCAGPDGLYPQAQTVAEEVCRVEIPVDYAGLLHEHPAAARAWRDYLRRVIDDCLGRGFVVVDFVRTGTAQERRCWYVLRRDVPGGPV
jgi:predicted GNAT superfamily acetyltransferase